MIQGFKRLKKVLRRRVMLRKWLILICLFSTWLLMLIAGLTSSRRQVYSATALATTQTYQNGTGQVKLLKQVYSAKKKALLLEFQTTDQTNSLNAGIAPKNLKWQLFAKNPQPNMRLTVIPLVAGKITVLVSGVAPDFKAIAINIKNKTPDTDGVNIEINSSSSSNANIKSNKNNNSTVKDNEVQFIIADNSKYLKYREIANVSRKALAQAEIKTEIAQQRKEKRRIKVAIKTLQRGIKVDQDNLQDLDAQNKYLVGQDRDDNNDNARELASDIADKQGQIKNAKANLTIIDQRIMTLEKKLAAIKAGSFDYGAQVKTYQLK